MIEIFLVWINSGIIAPIYGYFLLSIFVIFIVQTIRRRKILLGGIRSYTFWLLLISGGLFAISYSSYYESSLLIAFILYVMDPAIVFIAGYILTKILYNKIEGNIENIIYAIAIGCGIHVFLNIIANVGNDRWHMVDFFGNIKTPATNLGSLNTLIFSLFPCIFISESQKVKIGGILLFFLSLFYSFILGTRTQILVMLIVSLLMMTVYFIGHNNKRFFLKITLFFGVTILIIIICYQFNVFNIKEKIKTSNLVFRFIDSNTMNSDYYRIQLLVKGITSLFIYPLGGNKEVTYFHNYWLDIGRIAGTLTVVIVILYDIVVIYHMKCIFKDKRIKEVHRYILLCLTVGFFLNFFMEPIMEGYIDLLYRFYLINGLIEGLYNIKVKGTCMYKTT